jgi:excisionase family DNA binding protein
LWVRVEVDVWLAGAGVVRPLVRVRNAAAETGRTMPTPTHTQLDLGLTRRDPPLPLALTVPEAAALAGVSTRTMYRAVEAGSVPTVRLTPRGRVFIPRLALERFLAEGG